MPSLLLAALITLPVNILFLLTHGQTMVGRTTFCVPKPKALTNKARYKI